MVNLQGLSETGPGYCIYYIRASQNCTPLQLLPRVSKDGDQQQIPMTLGTTNKMAPETPDLAGSPTWWWKSAKLTSAKLRGDFKVSTPCTITV